MNKTDIQYILHCVKNASELINQSEIEKAKGLLLSAELLLSEKLASDNSDYAKCIKHGTDNKKCHAYNNGECMNAFVCREVNE